MTEDEEFYTEFNNSPIGKRLEFVHKLISESLGEEDIGAFIITKVHNTDHLQLGIKLLKTMAENHGKIV